MVRHIVAWNHRDGLSAAERKANALRVKAELEALTRCIPGIVSLQVYTDPLPSGNRDIVLDSLFESREALEAYQAHPEHQRASAVVGALVQNRACADYCEDTGAAGR